MFSHLSVEWSRFAIAAALLLIPLPLFFGKGTQLRELDRSWHRYVPKVFSLPWHWIDLLRTGAGMWLLLDAIGYSRSPNAALLPKGVLVILGATLFVALVLQTVACKQPGGFYAPCVFVFAVTATLYPPLLAGFALVAAITAAIAIRSVPVFFLALPFCIVGLGALLLPKWLLLAVWAPLTIWPALLPILFQRDFLFAHRAVAVEVEPAHR